MIRFVLYSALVSLMSLSVSAQEGVSPDPGSGLQEQSATPAGEARDIGQPSAEQVAAEPGNDQHPTVVQTSNDQQPGLEQSSASQTVEPDVKASVPDLKAAVPAAAEPNPKDYKPAASAARSPAVVDRGSKARKHAAVKPRAKRPNHAAQQPQHGPAYRPGSRGPRYAYRWAYSPWYGYYLYRPGYYSSHGYYPRYR